MTSVRIWILHCCTVLAFIGSWNGRMKGYTPPISTEAAEIICVDNKSTVVSLNCSQMQGGLIYIQTAIIGWSEGFTMDRHRCVADSDLCREPSSSVKGECHNKPHCNLGWQVVIRNISKQGCPRTNYLMVNYSCHTDNHLNNVSSSIIFTTEARMNPSSEGDEVHGEDGTSNTGYIIGISVPCTLVLVLLFVLVVLLVKRNRSKQHRRDPPPGGEPPSFYMAQYGGWGQGSRPSEKHDQPDIIAVSQAPGPSQYEEVDLGDGANSHHPAIIIKQTHSKDNRSPVTLLHEVGHDPCQPGCTPQSRLARDGPRSPKLVPGRGLTGYELAGPFYDCHREVSDRGSRRLKALKCQVSHTSHSQDTTIVDNVVYENTKK